MRVSLKSVVEENSSRHGRVFDLFIQGLIVVSLVSFSIETLPDLEPATYRNLFWIEAACIFVFTIEYTLRVVVATRKLGFVFSFFGLIDLLAILPFYLAIGIDLRALRSLRLLRLFRAFKLFRYSKAIRRFHRAFILVKEELILFFFTTSLLLYLAGAGIYMFENPVQPEAFSSVFDGLWWAVVTLTTVGYGDVIPLTVGGKLFTFVVLMIGLGVVAVPTGLVASALGRAREEEAKAKETE